MRASPQRSNAGGGALFCLAAWPWFLTAEALQQGGQLGDLRRSTPRPCADPRASFQQAAPLPAAHHLGVHGVTVRRGLTALDVAVAASRWPLRARDTDGLRRRPPVERRSFALLTRSAPLHEALLRWRMTSKVCPGEPFLELPVLRGTVCRESCGWPTNRLRTRRVQ